jgi:hypothetical protein
VTVYTDTGDPVRGKINGLTENGFLEVRIANDRYETYPTVQYSFDI